MTIQPEALKQSIDALIQRLPAALGDEGHICHQLGASFLTLAGYEHPVENLTHAIEAYTNALICYPADIHPAPHATIQNERGMAYRKLAHHRDPLANLNRAVVCHQAALKLLNPASDEYARTQTHLGNAFQMSAYTGDLLPNLFRAINAYEKALERMAPEHTDYAATQNNLGLVYARLAQANDKRGNLERAINAHRAALETYTPADHPLAYAQTQRNLGIAHEDIGEPTTAILCWEAAATCYERIGDTDRAAEMRRWIETVKIAPPPPAAESPSVLRNLLRRAFGSSG